LATHTDFLLEPHALKELDRYLMQRGFLEPHETVVRLEPAGTGNMNVVLRAETAHRTFILKQSRPWVNRFPAIAAPIDRTGQEYQFYLIVRKNEVLRQYTPEIFFYDASNHLLCMEDLGEASDYSFIYQKGSTLDRQQMADVARAVSELHFLTKDLPEGQQVQNKALRQLNHQHIFELPLQADNGFDLDSVLPGLQAATDRFRSDARIKKVASELGRIYLSDSSGRLLHGDYYPGSWLNTRDGFRMIDPEFCYTGRPEFELGVTVAHLRMAQQPDSLIKDIFVYYHFDDSFDGSLFSKFTGMEMVRRLIGIAQLPLGLDLRERVELLDEAYQLVVNG